MPRKQDYRLSEEVRNYIINQKRKNISPSIIKANILITFNRSISYSTIRHTWERYLSTGSIQYKQPAGRTKALSERDERSLVRDFISQPGKSIKGTFRLQGQHPIAKSPISRRTIRRTLRRKGLLPRTSDKGKEVTTKNRKKRFIFASSHADWTSTDWSKVVFTDEATLFPLKTRTRVIWSYIKSRRAPPFEESFQDKSVNVWGYLRYDGEMEIFRFEGTMRQKKYIEMIEDKIYKAIAPPRHETARLIFMLDNASYHTAKSVKKWFRENSINPLTWPAQSPDLSPIENVWGAIKNELWNQRAKIKNWKDTWALSKEIVRNLRLTYIHNLYESMPKRIDDVLKSKGNRIAY